MSQRLNYGKVSATVALTIWVLAVAAPGLQLNRGANPTRWVTTDGQFVNPFLANHHPTVLVFLLTDCPIGNLFAPELSRIEKHYRPRGVRFIAAFVDSKLSRDAAQKHAREYGIDCPIVLDPTYSLAKRAGATVSPEAVVISKRGEVVYRGRIDDRALDYGKIRPEPRSRDLRRTLDTVLLGKPVKVSRTKAVGCIFRAEGQ